MKCLKGKFDKVTIVFSSIGLAFALLVLFALIDKESLLSTDVLYLSLMISGTLLAASLILFISTLLKKLNKKMIATSAFFTLSSCVFIILIDVVSNKAFTFTFAFQLAITIGLIVTYALSLSKEKLKLPVIILLVIELLMTIPAVLAASSIHLSLAVLLLFIIISLLIKEEKINE